MFNLATLPPTMSAAEQHILRTYFQVQQWKNNILNPTDWGWIMHDSVLCPIQSSTEAVAPNWLQETVFCNCKNGCKTNCSCRNVVLPCSEACGHCHSECTNRANFDLNFNDNDSDSEI